MGPWLRSHGRTPAGRAQPAVATLQWGRGFAATEGTSAAYAACRSMNGFNGAVASQPRKGQSGQGMRLLQPSLQWGRGFAATEGRPSSASVPRRSSFNGAVASQPRKVLVCRYACCLLRSFNGAVASQPRKDDCFHSQGQTIGNASMGPWLRSHGRLVYPASING